MKYTLIKNKLNSSEKAKYIARHIKVIRKNFNNLLKDITIRGSLLKPADNRSAIENYWNTIISYIEDGEEYSDDYINVKLGISGRFDDTNNRFNRKLHKVTISFNPSENVKKSALKIKPKYVSYTFKYPNIYSVFNWKTQSQDQQLTPNEACEIKGTNLKIYNSTDDQGIFFISKETYKEYPVTDIHTNEPQLLLFRIPDLPKGEYTIEIRNTIRNRKQLRRSTHSVTYFIS